MGSALKVLDSEEPVCRERGRPRIPHNAIRMVCEQNQQLPCAPWCVSQHDAAFENNRPGHERDNFAQFLDRISPRICHNFD